MHRPLTRLLAVVALTVIGFGVAHPVPQGHADGFVGGGPLPHGATLLSADGFVGGGPLPHTVIILR